jgi:PhnB protein
MAQPTIQLIPYLNFSGNCEEALNFYKGIIGGDIIIASRYDNPNMQAPEAFRDKILHARYDMGDGVTMYASDVMPGRPMANGSGDVSLSLAFSDLETGKKVFTALAEGGKVQMPFEKQFWGDWYGGLTDKYGMHWNVNFSERQ